MFSFSGSWNVTVFLVAAPILDAGLETADFKPGVGSVETVVVIVPAVALARRTGARDVFLAGCLVVVGLANCSPSLSSSVVAAVVLRVRVLARVVLAGSGLEAAAEGAVVATLFALPRDALVEAVEVFSFAGSGLDAGSGSGMLSAILFGRPRVRAGLFMVPCCSASVW